MKPQPGDCIVTHLSVSIWDDDLDEKVCDVGKDSLLLVVGTTPQNRMKRHANYSKVVTFAGLTGWVCHKTCSIAIHAIL